MIWLARVSQKPTCDYEVLGLALFEHLSGSGAAEMEEIGMRLPLAYRFLLRLLLALSLCLPPVSPVHVTSAPPTAATATAAATAAPTCITNPVVTNNAESGAGSLREAIAEACPGSTITFAGAVTSPIILTSGDLEINQSLSIVGPGQGLLTVERSSAQGTSQFRIFTIAASTTVDISGLTITGGHAPDGITASPNGGNGGGILNQGTL